VSNYTQVVILCEDRQQEVFARHFLVKCGVNRHRIHVKVSPKGAGAAEQYVRQQYPVEVLAYRANRHRINIALVVMIDADTREVVEHFRELENALHEATLSERQPDEQIGVFVPKRNIETWIHYLQGQSVNEIEEYPRFKGNEGICRPLVERLAINRDTPLPESAPNSLKIACSELKRILPQVKSG